jgi:dienelactone hydrolase
LLIRFHSHKIHEKLFTLGATLLSLAFSASAQKMASCCARPAGNLSASATEVFAMLASIGWCFGGGWSLQEALLGGKQTVGCVMYYGMPEKDVARLKTLNSDVLGIFASQDKWISPEVVARFKKDMAAAGKSLTVESYDADHAFANPSNPKYKKADAAQAHAHALAYLRGRFKVKV